MFPHTLNDPHDLFHNRRPDFLVISPPKTGSTWLAANLRHHPQLFIPESKEIKYFSSLFKWLDFGWYCRQFGAAGPRRAGEASPSYASLPLDCIRHIRRLLPDLKLVFLMRDPIARAWSHAKHNHKYGEANFGSMGSPTDSAAVTDDQWRANFAHDWPLVAGDYLGQLRRWMSVFPREQIYVGFYESIIAEPAALLREVFQFLEVDPTVDLANFPVSECILSGSPTALSPQLASDLRALLQSRTQELAVFLHDKFGLEIPPEWQTIRGQPADAVAVPSEAFRREADDDYLAKVMALEEAFPSDPRLIEEHRGYNIVFYRGQLYAFARSLGRLEIPALDRCTLQRFQDEGTCIIGQTCAEMRERITTQLLEQANSRLEAAERQLQLARETISRVAREANEATAQLAAELSANMAAVIAILERPSRPWRLLRALMGLQPERDALRKYTRRLVRRIFPLARQQV